MIVNPQGLSCHWDDLFGLRPVSSAASIQALLPRPSCIRPFHIPVSLLP